MELNSDVVNLISHATQERLRGLLEKLTVIARHRVSTHKVKEIISKFSSKFSCFAALKVNLFQVWAHHRQHLPSQYLPKAGISCV